MKRIKSKNKLTTDQLFHLIHGWCLDSCEPWYGKLGFPFPDEGARATAWELHKDEIMKRMGDPQLKMHDPKILWGSRPRAFWEYDSPEPRNWSQDEMEQLDLMGALKPGERRKREQFEAKKKAFYERLKRKAFRSENNVVKIDAFRKE